MMLSDKELKKKFGDEFTENYEKYFPVSELKGLGFSRGKCTNCGKHFWSSGKRRKLCGEPECIGGYKFIGKEHNPMSFTDVWKKFRNLLSSMGYTPIKRYPVVSRWNPTSEFTIASISDFQPYVVNGTVKAPANPLIVPQLCLRFNDIDNVGITGRHFTGFTMIGQHAFLPPDKFDQGKMFLDYFRWFDEGMKINKKDLIIHEDIWAGGGNFGPCLEFFSKGLELGNQVYMFFEQDHKGNKKELDIKVLDMGMGQERCAWYSQGTLTNYEAVFPSVFEYIKKITGINFKNSLLKKFVSYAGILDFEKSDTAEKSWDNISRKIGIKKEKLKEEIMKYCAVYSVGEHTRTLLYALNDGALPSNTGGNYNLRVIYRRVMDFIHKYCWDIDPMDIIRLHADYLKKQYPEMTENLNDIKNIIEVEKKKYLENKKRSRKIIENTLKHNKIIGKNKLIELYDSQGINPEDLKKEAEENNYGVKVEIPPNFYALISEKQEKQREKEDKKIKAKIGLKDIPETNPLYYESYDILEFRGIVLKVIDNKVILNETAFYPTSGGQIHDKGFLANYKVVDVFKQGNVIVHVLDKKPDFKKGQKVKGRIDRERRIQLAQHHTATHIVNGAAKKHLGNHIWQAGASKTMEKSRLDITHYENLSDNDINEIEKIANDIVKKNVPVYKTTMKRALAESKYGFGIYQGGAVPGKELRIVEIPDFDVEACGGTHLNTTGEVISIKIIKTSKIQDGVVRIEFLAGQAAEDYFNQETNQINELVVLLKCDKKQIPARCEELFNKWKLARKNKLDRFELKSKDKYKGDIMNKSALILKTQPEYVVKTVKRFIEDIKKEIH